MRRKTVKAIVIVVAVVVIAAPPVELVLEVGPSQVGRMN